MVFFVQKKKNSYLAIHTKKRESKVTIPITFVLNDYFWEAQSITSIQGHKLLETTFQNLFYNPTNYYTVESTAFS